jgi:carboxypeptidase Q
MPSLLAIGDFARATHLSVKTLRHYHESGLLEPADVDPQNGYRRYTADQISTAQIIRRFRDLDMPLNDIHAVLTAPDLQTRNGHFDSWQGGTGATDNGTGSSVAMEAVRILATLHKPLARTVRVALWGGEEEGVYGSTAYVQQHFAQRATMVKTPEYDKLDVYFNDDGGSGRFRGVSAGGSAQMAAIFKSWIEPIKDQHIVAVSGGDQFRPTASPGGTDSSAFSWIGLNGIGFQQDGLEYGTRTHHSNADTYDRVQKDDVMQSSMIEAWFAYNAATRAEMLPRIPTPAPDPNAKSHE